MAKSSVKHYSRYCRQAARLLGQLIRARRIERQVTTTELAERVGISRGLLQRIEKGDLSCSIGAVFEASDVDC